MNYIKIFKNNNFQKIAIRKCTISIGSVFPTGILVDIINSTGNNQSCTTNDAQDLGEILKSHNKAVVFALPGALTPTCAAKHLPGFINHAEILRAKGVDGIFCVSVNDKFVMKAWGEMTPNFNKSGIQLIAGNYNIIHFMIMISYACLQMEMENTVKQLDY